jgi:hypothetical protein
MCKIRYTNKDKKFTWQDCVKAALVVLLYCTLLWIVCCEQEVFAPCPSYPVSECNYKQYIENIRMSPPGLASYSVTHEKGIVKHFMVFVGGVIRNLNDAPVRARTKLEIWFNVKKDPKEVEKIVTGQVGVEIIPHPVYGRPYMSLDGIIEELPPCGWPNAPYPDGSYVYLAWIDFTPEYQGKAYADLPSLIYYEIYPFIEFFPIEPTIKQAGVIERAN